MKFEKEVRAILAGVGGKENVISLAHCASRLRLEVKDQGLVLEERLGSLIIVKGVFFSQGQLQIVIGPEKVEEVAQELGELLKVEVTKYDTPIDMFNKLVSGLKALFAKTEAKVEEVKAEVTAQEAPETPAVKVTGPQLVYVPLAGEVKPLAECKDPGFSSGAMGEGVVIIPADNKVYAPFDGTVTTLFPTKHAVIVTGDNGVELLVHIGMDTVALNGQGFTSHVEKGDKVTKGQLLVEFDPAVITEAGYSTETPVVVVNEVEDNEFSVTANPATSATTSDVALTVVFK